MRAAAVRRATARADRPGRRSGLPASAGSTSSRRQLPRPTRSTAATSSTGRSRARRCGCWCATEGRCRRRSDRCDADATVEPADAALRGWLHRHAGRRPEGHQRSSPSAIATIPETDAPAIEARGLTKRFGDFTAAERHAVQHRRAGRSSACSAPTARASRPPSRCCAACSRPPRAAGRWPAIDLRTRGGRGARIARLHGAEILALRRSQRSPEPRFLRRRLRSRPGRGARGDRAR